MQGMIANPLLDGLNPQQQQAVMAGTGPVLSRHANTANSTAAAATATPTISKRILLVRRIKTDSSKKNTIRIIQDIKNTAKASPMGKEIPYSLPNRIAMHSASGFAQPQMHIRDHSEDRS